MTPRLMPEVQGDVSVLAHGHPSHAARTVRVNPQSEVLASIGLYATRELAMRGSRCLIAKFFIHQDKHNGPNCNDR